MVLIIAAIAVVSVGHLVHLLLRSSPAFAPRRGALGTHRPPTLAAPLVTLGRAAEVHLAALRRGATWWAASGFCNTMAATREEVARR